MNLKKLPYTIKQNIEYKKADLDAIVLYNNSTELNKWLIDNKYLTLEETNDRYNIYKGTNLLKDSSFEEILLKMTNLTYEEYKTQKLVKFKNLHISSLYEFEELIESLNDVDGYFNKVNLESKELKASLIMHGLANECGPNGYSAYGTEILNKYVENEEYETIFKLVTGKSYEDYNKYQLKKLKKEEVKKLKKLAKKYNYKLIKN